MTLVSKVYGGALRPSDPRRFLVEAIVAAMRADGHVSAEERDALERNLSDHEMFSGLSPEIVRALVEMAEDSISIAGGVLKRVPYIAKGLPSHAHRMAAYAVACEIAFSDGTTREELVYLDLLRNAFLLSDEEARSLYEAATQQRGMQEVEARTRHLQSLVPFYLQAMAIMASMDGTVTAAERQAVENILKGVADLNVLGERELGYSIEEAFRRIEGKDPEAEVRNLATALDGAMDRFWAVVYMMAVAVADGYTNWRQLWLLGTAQEVFGLSDTDMDRATETAKSMRLRKD